MSNEEAKKTLQAVGGLFFMVKMSAISNGDPSDIVDKLLTDYLVAVEVASAALDAMDTQLKIEEKGE